MTTGPAPPAKEPLLTRASDPTFYAASSLLGASYVGLIVALLLAMATFTTPSHLLAALQSPEIRHSVRLSLISSTLSALLSLWVAVPLGYLLARHRFPLRGLVDGILDIPIVLPPLVVGLGLLILFQTPAGKAIERHLQVTFAVPAVILAQFTVAAAFAVRTMRITFEQIHPRAEQVALTLGCNRSQAFFRVLLPAAGRGCVAAVTLAWARSLGEFGPVLVFAGATRLRTEVLPTTVFLELSIGNVESAVAVSLLMVGAALIVLMLARAFGVGGRVLS